VREILPVGVQNGLSCPGVFQFWGWCSKNVQFAYSINDAGVRLDIHMVINIEPTEIVDRKANAQFLPIFLILLIKFF